MTDGNGNGKAADKRKGNFVTCPKCQRKAIPTTKHCPNDGTLMVKAGAPAPAAEKVVVAPPAAPAAKEKENEPATPKRISRFKW